jgi:hypothetical protein
MGTHYAGAAGRRDDGLEAEPGHGRGRHGDDPARRGSVRALSRERRNLRRPAVDWSGRDGGNASGRVGDLGGLQGRDPLDPVYGSGYLENTADWLMCESLLGQTPDGAVVPGLVSLPASTEGIVIGRSFA